MNAVNLWPYDGHWERVLMRYHLGGEKRPHVHSLSVTAEPEIADYVQQVLCMDLLKARLIYTLQFQA